AGLKDGFSTELHKSFEDRAVKADAMSDPKQRDERAKVWSQIFTDIQTKAAPWVPVFNERRVVAKSKRMGGPSILAYSQFSEIFRFP
ncbi:MAG: hypothetical protein JO234_04440, partial [Hyphomicrobiales bacterium]|nr:hypothetical protein [Hyphomicrobiales bacterium]